MSLAFLFLAWLFYFQFDSPMWAWWWVLMGVLSWTPSRRDR